jgi:hypothetical protein
MIRPSIPLLSCSPTTLCTHGCREPFDSDRPGLLSQNRFLDQRVCFVCQQNAAEIGVRLQPRCQIHLVSDDRVVHAIVAAEVSDRAETGIDADAKLEDVFLTPLAPLGLQIAHSLLHRNRHSHACDSVLPRSPGFRISKKQHDGVADEFVDGGAVLKRNRRHFPEILIQKIREFFGFQQVGLGKAGNIGKENRQLLALRSDLDVFLPAEYRFIQLRRQVLEGFVERDSSIRFFSETSLVAASARCLASTRLSSVRFSPVISVITVTAPPVATFRRAIR